MTVEIITLILRLVIAIVVGILAPATKKWLETKTENEKMNRLKETAETAVYAAEQLYEAVDKADPDSTERRKFAEHAIRRTAVRLGLALSDREVSEILEAAVQEINIMKYGGVHYENVGS